MRRGDPALTVFLGWSRVHGIVMILLACDLSDEALSADGPLTPEKTLELTRDLALSGVAVPEP